MGEAGEAGEAGLKPAELKVKVKVKSCEKRKAGASGEGLGSLGELAPAPQVGPASPCAGGLWGGGLFPSLTSAALRVQHRRPGIKSMPLR
ncbi:hypothetical protein GCM10009839_80410 [Catenulispora yoronensis]|uniref:Uncharacterized protein n=1 Tax=Catenulispora yoronensis TaxID=450799 RepID=A0ABP5GYU2_9ACTN